MFSKKKITFDGLNGAFPRGNLTLSNNKFYGIGGGSIFEWDPATNIIVKKNELGGASFGSLTPYAGKFYGMTYSGGSYSQGFLFEWDPVNNTVLNKFNFMEYNGTGFSPFGNLTVSGSKLYGMTAGEGGTLFEWDVATNVFTLKRYFVWGDGREPLGTLTLSRGMLYGMTSTGGENAEAGIIFEWNPASNQFTKKIDFNSKLNGMAPAGKLSQYHGKLYGVTSWGGKKDDGTIFEFDPYKDLFTKKKNFIELDSTFLPADPQDLFIDSGRFFGLTSYAGKNNSGTIYEWNPSVNSFKKLFDFGGANGRIPTNLTKKGRKFYGTTYDGGLYDKGVIFEWDPTTNIYTKKFDFNGINGDGPNTGLTLDHGRFYGVTKGGGANDAGVIFEWDPVSNTYSKKVDLSVQNGSEPGRGLTVYNGKFYGLTSWGGANNAGVIFEWDKVTNSYTKKVDMNNSPWGGLTLSGDKLYGVTERSVFEYDPVKNGYSVRKQFDYSGKEGAYANGHDFILAPAPVANGLPGACVCFNSVTIDSADNNKWVSITDSLGNAVAEIKANGNNLGIVSASMFISNTAVREDRNKSLYLDRSITLTPQTQPATPVDIRLYIKGSEYLALKNASNSDGNQPGIDSINDLAIYNVRGACAAAVAKLTNPVATQAEAWETDYVLSATISSLSSFCFAARSVTYYRDFDRDGFGDPYHSITSCSNVTPAGYVKNNYDCYDCEGGSRPGQARVRMCHDGWTQCVYVKDTAEKLNIGWSLGICPLQSCAADETLMCHNGKQECVKNTIVAAKLAEPGGKWSLGPYCSGVLISNYDSNSARKIEKTSTEKSTPTQYGLSNHPNPFAGTCTIKYELPLDSKVLIKVYDFMGRTVATLVDEYKKAGTYTVNFNASRFSSGSLFYKIIATSKEGEFERTNQMVKIK